MCDFLANPDPIAFAGGGFRCRGRPSFRRHVRLISRKWRIHLAPPDHFRPSAKAGADNFGKIIKFCHFGENSAPIAIAIGIFRSRDRPSFRLHVRFGKSGPYICRGWDISMSGPPEFPARMRLIFRKWRITLAPSDHFMPSAKARGR